MNKVNFLTFFCSLIICSAFGQNAIKIDLAKQITASASHSIKLYKFNSKNKCNQSKSVSIIDGDKVSTCFDYVKTISTSNTKKIASLLRESTTYGNEDVACFDTEYGLLIFDKSNVVIGYINISWSCNKLISNPIISEREQYAKQELRKVGFSKKGRSSLIKLLEILDSH
ncbi:hypothetical protein ACI6Q2_23145 [Chitinophagaceae bacterium LWZ2-11]